MFNHLPRISIGLPVYNGEKYLPAAIESLLAQSYADFELIISDNVSTDGTAEICRRYAARDARVRYLRQETNGGAPWNFNQVFQAARGEFFKWHPADDVCAPTLLARCLALLEADPSIALCYPRTMVIDAQGNPLPAAPGSWLQTTALGSAGDYNGADARGLDSQQYADRARGILLHTVFCYELFGLIRSHIMRRTGLHRDSSSLGKAFLLEVAFQGRLVEVPEILFYNRRHAQQYTMLADAAQQRQFDRPGRKHRGRPWPHHFRCTAVYAGCIWRAPISWWQRVRCGAVLLRYVFQLGKWKRIVAAAWHGTGMWDGSIVVPPPTPLRSAIPAKRPSEPFAGPASIGPQSPGRLL